MEKTELKRPYQVPIAWVRGEGQGRVFYSSLGHRDDVWQSDDFQEHLAGGIGWALGNLEAEATPNPERQADEAELARKAYESSR